MVHCKYAVAPAEVWAGNDLRNMKKIEPERELCAWADFHPESAEKLSNTPPWLQRNALSGHLMRKADCDTCPCFERGDPVEVMNDRE